MKRPFAPSTVEQLSYSLNEIHRVGMEYIRAGKVLAIQISDPNRSVEQNRLLWPLLTLWAKFQTICVNGDRVHITKEGWKVILLASYRKRHGIAAQLAQGLDGELVPLGYETHAMPKPEFAGFLTFILAETGERQMELPARVDYSDYMGRVAA